MHATQTESEFSLATVRGRSLKLVHFKDFLKSHGITPVSWGSVYEKNVHALWNDILKGNVIVGINMRTQQLMLTSEIVEIYVQYEHLVLVLQYQHHDDGRKTECGLPYTLRKAIKIGLHPEEVYQTALRLLNKSVGIANTPLQLVGDRLETPKPSLDYPGLLVDNHLYRFTVQLTRDRYDSRGIRKRNIERTDYFKWRYPAI